MEKKKQKRDQWLYVAVVPLPTSLIVMAAIERPALKVEFTIEQKEDSDVPLTRPGKQ